MHKHYTFIETTYIDCLTFYLLCTYFIVVFEGSTKVSIKEKVKRDWTRAQNKAFDDFIYGGGGKPKIGIPLEKRRQIGKWSD